MEVMESSSSLTLLSSDSLRDAFASLDAASAAERGLYSLNSLSDSAQHCSRIVRDASSSVQDDNSSMMRAQRIQYFDPLPRRALCGGETMERMRSEVQDRAERNKRKKEGERKKVLQQISGPLLLAQADAPSFQAFPMSMEIAEDYIQETDNQQDLGNNVEAEQVSHTSTDTNQLPLEPSGSHPCTDETANAQPARKRKTFQWAARRDRRIARRREVAPLTRSQARQLETREGDSAAQGSSGQQKSSASITSESLSAEVTDPSYGTIVVEVSIPVKTRGAAAKRKKKVAPMLDMTLTEQAIRPIHEKQKTLSQESSQTQSDIYSQEQTCSTSSKRPILKGQRMVISGRLSSDSSETEEEEEEDAEKVDGAWRQRSLSARIEKQVKKPMTARKRTLREKKHVEPKTTTPRQRGKAKAKARGPPLFHGMAFLLFGFWAKIKTFSSLIEKHGGSIFQPDDIKSLSEPEKILYLVACTHSGYKPAPGEVDKWKLQFGIDTKNALDVKQFFAQKKMIHAEWISECIAKCLCPEDLLSMDSYIITT